MYLLNTKVYLDATVVILVVTAVHSGCCVVYDNLINVKKHNNVAVYLQQQKGRLFTIEKQRERVTARLKFNVLKT